MAFMSFPPEVWDLLVSDALWYHHREAQNHSPEHSHSPFLDGGIIFPPLSGMLDPCQSSSNNWRLISFGTTWLHPKLVLKKKKKKKPFPLSFSPSLASLYLFEQWLRLGVTSTSSVWLPLQDESLYVFPNCKSLWIKVSAKWLNVNVNVNCPSGSHTVMTSWWQRQKVFLSLNVAGLLSVRNAPSLPRLDVVRQSFYIS